MLIMFQQAVSNCLRLIISVLLLCLPSISFAELDPITSVPEIRVLAPEVAEEGLPVQVEGQILWRNPFSRSFYMQNEGKGIYVHQRGEAFDYKWYQPGTRVRVTGVTRKGTFIPFIYYESIEPLGSAPMPKSRPFLAFETYSTSIDCDWVNVKGRILSVQIYSKRDGDPRAVLEVESRDLSQNVMVPLTEGAEEKIRSMMFQRVRFDAVVATQTNMTRQAVGRVFYVNSVDDFTVTNEPVPMETPNLLKVRELMSSDIDPREQVRIRGRVTHVDGQKLYLRGEQVSIKATARDQPEVYAGDYVEMVGVALPDPISPAFLARVVQVIERGPAPEPVHMELNDKLWNRWAVSPDSSLHQELVQVEARLVDVGESYGLTTGEKEQLLLCRQEESLFTVKLSSELGKEDLTPGSMLRITGICNLTRSGKPDWRLQIDGFWIQPRGADDIEVLSAAPWWTAARFLWALGILAAIIVFITVWAFLLRRTVGKQTTVIAKQVEHASVLNERQRIARELHDTLEQGLSALKMQMKLIHREVETGLPQELPLVDSAQTMLEACSRESRASIQDLRGGLLEQMDLLSAIRESVEQRLKESEIDLQIEVLGDARRLTLFAEQQILRLVTEAAGNAIQHGAPSTLSIQMHYTEDQLKVEVRDDGCGFDPKAAESSGRFGLLGMHERANRLHAELLLESQKGKGSSVCFTVPIVDFIEEKSV